MAAALTAGVPYATRRTHLPLNIPEPDMVYARRCAQRAFLYATCINVFAGISIVGATAIYCEIDNVRISMEAQSSRITIQSSFVCCNSPSFLVLSQFDFQSVFVFSD